MALTVTYKSVLIVLAIFVTSFQFNPFQRGFYCSDTSIQNPFIPIFYRTKLLFTVAIAVPLIVIFVVTKYVQNDSKKNILRQLAKFWFGFVLNLTLNELTKKLVGRLRPHTYQLCDLQRYCPEDRTVDYVPSFECEQSIHYYYSINTRLSFFSGHSSIGSFTGAYIVLFLLATLFRNYRRMTAGKKLAVVGLNVAIMLFYLYPGFTQWQIYWHFASDVATGHTIGVLMAYAIMRSVNL